MKTPLHLISVPCRICKGPSNLLDVNMRHENLYNEQGSACLFPKDGLTEDQVIKVNTVQWTCEVCHEESEGNQ